MKDHLKWAMIARNQHPSPEAFDYFEAYLQPEKDCNGKEIWEIEAWKNDDLVEVYHLCRCQECSNSRQLIDYRLGKCFACYEKDKQNEQ